MKEEDVTGFVPEQYPAIKNKKQVVFKAELDNPPERQSEDNFLDELNDRLIMEQESGKKACINGREQARLDAICENAHKRLNQYAKRGLEELARLGVGLNIQKALNPQRFGKFLQTAGIKRSSATLYQRLAKNPEAVRTGIEYNLSMRQVLRNICQKRRADNPKAKVQAEQTSGEAGQSAQNNEELSAEKATVNRAKYQFTAAEVTAKFRSLVQMIEQTANLFDDSIKAQLAPKVEKFAVEVELVLGDQG